jgi:hypothetical protein
MNLWVYHNFFFSHDFYGLMGLKTLFTHILHGLREKCWIAYGWKDEKQRKMKKNHGYQSELMGLKKSVIVFWEALAIKWLPSFLK